LYLYAYHLVFSSAVPLIFNVAFKFLTRKTTSGNPSTSTPEQTFSYNYKGAPFLTHTLALTLSTFATILSLIVRWRDRIVAVHESVTVTKIDQGETNGIENSLIRISGERLLEALE
jgi:hypothetical protein